ncbi:hypothetical protein [Sphingobium sp. Z007]|uniref:hypothetical protein n=1 Tax=Sphingobium sp. Z007 TaxID=627495 RepID=UPI001124EE0E|nr:hypothetical protein [Sphingobium sp. Z007]
MGMIGSLEWAGVAMAAPAHSALRRRENDRSRPARKNAAKKSAAIAAINHDLNGFIALLLL